MEEDYFFSNNSRFLFRGQAGKYRDKPFAPSALRYHNIQNMEIKLKNEFAININYFKARCLEVDHSKLYENIDAKAMYSFWLSLTNCSFAVRQNKLIEQNCNSLLFKEISQNLNYSQTEIAEICIKYAYNALNPKENNDYIKINDILHDYAFFQHLNYVFYNRIGGNYNSLYPTMLIDWTWSQEVADKFKGYIYPCSFFIIDYILYKKIFSDYKNQPMSEYPYFDLKKDRIYGFETFTDPENFYIKDDVWRSTDNNLMVEQKGAVIFWPWTYTCEEMLDNDNFIRKTMGFRMSWLDEEVLNY